MRLEPAAVAGIMPRVTLCKGKESRCSRFWKDKGMLKVGHGYRNKPDGRAGRKQGGKDVLQVSSISNVPSCSKSLSQGSGLALLEP